MRVGTYSDPRPGGGHQLRAEFSSYGGLYDLQLVGSCNSRPVMARGISCLRENDSGTSCYRILVTCLLLWTMTSLVEQSRLVEALSDSDREALQEIGNSLEDLPGSSFLSSWTFSDSSVNPCDSFNGVQCFEVDGVQRVVVLNLGEPTAGSEGLKGTLSEAVGKLTALAQLSIAPGSVSGSIPWTLGSLTELQFLGLSGNKLEGSIPWDLSNLNKLQSVILSGNKLTGPIPDGIGRLPSLTTLSLADNKLSGNVPDFTAAKSLKHLDLSGNELTGSLPLLPYGVKYVSLSDNRLDGGMDRIKEIRSLTYLDLGTNQLSDEVPPEVFSFPLQYLMLDRNKLSGSLHVPSPCIIPMVDLSYNSLSGLVPTGLAGVRTLYLNNNRFSGMVPPIYSFNLQTGVVETLYLQDNYLIGLTNLLPGMSLPSDVTLCFQFNCGLPPTQSSCPSKDGVDMTRPIIDCLSPEITQTGTQP
ncbi:hypothetical protein R1sor_018785 [Riccia sorocarpa]|uniref:Leucine-rich repeat-containing N-terminal plant-type domain-containing protein n=1 Tax=Riccia sorocarpa TaxID=122646 RepID=A0ABD3IAN6_9MARC